MISNPRRPAAIGLSLLVAGVLWGPSGAAQSNGSAPEPQVVDSGVIPQSAFDSIRRELASFTDPQQRRARQGQYRALAIERHPDLAEMLNLDAATEQRLIDLLGELELKKRQREIEAFLGSFDGRDPTAGTMADYAGRITQERSPIKELLGTAGFGRYVDYARTLQHRANVALFNRRLGAEDALSREQREQLTALLANEDGKITPLFNYPTNGPIFSHATEKDPARRDQLLRVDIAEASVARVLEVSTQLTQAAAQFLTPRQQAAFAALQEEGVEAQRENLRAQRRAAGMDPDAPVTSAASSPAKVATPKRVRWTADIAVDSGPPKTLKFLGAVGEPVTFDIDAGLSIRTVPLLRGSELRLDMKVQETLGDGPHVIGTLYAATQLQAAPVPDSGWTRQQQQMVLAGSRGYVITWSVGGTAQ